MPDILTLAAALAVLTGSVVSQTAAPDAAPRPAGGHGRTAFIEGYDTNRDGKVDRAEYDAVRSARFATGDLDEDGFLTEEEYVAEYAGRLRAQYAADQRQPDGAFDQQLRQASVRLYAIDRDRDGRISAEENRAVAHRTFEGADTNGDGVVSQDDPIPPPRAEGGHGGGATRQ